MPCLLRLLAGAAVAACVTLALLPGAALSASKGKIKAFNPQPDPPGKAGLKGSKSLGVPDTKGSWKRVHDVEKSKRKGSWKRIHDVEEKSKSKGGSKSLPAVQKRK